MADSLKLKDHSPGLNRRKWIRSAVEWNVDAEEEF